jgi:phage tail-like protein
MAEVVDGRTRATADPVRNFKFLVSFYMGNSRTGVSAELEKIGFTSVEGLSMSTDVVAYREGGWNTNPHKLPGQSDFAPLSCSSGVFYDRPGIWSAAKQMFAFNWGGTIGPEQDFRFNLVIDVLDHPVTVEKPKPEHSVIQFRAHNAWIASVAFGGLNAGDNGVLVHNMTIHHEGLEVLYKGDDRYAKNAALRYTTSPQYAPQF